jgi:hypothetical protein
LELLVDGMKPAVDRRCGVAVGSCDWSFGQYQIIIIIFSISPSDKKDVVTNILIVCL